MLPQLRELTGAGDGVVRGNELLWVEAGCRRVVVATDRAGNREARGNDTSQMTECGSGRCHAQPNRPCPLPVTSRSRVGYATAGAGFCPATSRSAMGIAAMLTTRCTTRTIQCR